MTIQDMDICLNVTADPVVTKKSKLKRTEYSTTSIKRLKNHSFHKKAVLGSKESKRNANTQEIRYKKRVKQKSLSAIVAKKLKETNSVTLNIPQSQIASRGKGARAKTIEPNNIEQSNATKKKDVKSDKILSIANSDFTNESLVSFTKATKHVGTKRLAKKRDDSKGESKRSLSNIFSSQLKNFNESDILNLTQKHDVHKDNFKSDKKSKVAKKTSVLKSDKTSSIANSDSINEPTMTFTKATREQVGRVLLAKKKNNSKGEPKRSLSDIFSSRLKNQNESETLNLTQKHNISKNNFKSDKKSKVVAKKTSVLKSGKISSIANSDSTNEPPVAFAKATQEHVGRVLLAKKKDDSKAEPKRSLSDIFSNQLKNQNESDTLNLTQKDNISKNNFKSDKKYKITKESASKNTKMTDISNKRKEKRNKEKIVNNDRKSDKTPKLMHRTGGKISSLFGNNPDVPTMGQRFVKPVHESVFTEVTFADLNIHPYTISNLEQNMGITKMTTVQQKAIPQIFSAKDVLIRSQTGSGKTLAYALPIVELLHKIRPQLNRNSGLSALVIVPTRELALQTYECFIKLVKPFTWIVPGYIIGGEKRKAEKARLRKGCNILVSTPGRLLDHIKHTKALRLNDVKYFVLDEADRMLDMGYEMDISGIVSALKVSCSNNEESGYDAMKILKQNSKKIFTDEDEISKEDIKLKIEKNNTDGSKKKQIHHSNDDGDCDQAANAVLSKKRKKDVKRSAVNRESDSKAENVPNVEQHYESQSRRQTILLSATLTHAVEKLAGLTMHDPIFVDAAKENVETSGGNDSEINEDLIVPQSVNQNYIVTPPKLRMVTLSAYIAGRCQTPGQHKILIFMATQDMVDYHTEILSSVLTKPTDDDDEDSDPLVDVEFFKLHGNMTQKERTEIFKTFSQAKTGVLLCTDVAARGLDMPKVDCVVQYTGPISARDYVHRIGRTARAGCSGTATIFLTPSEIEFVRMLESRRIRIKQQDMNDVLDKLLGPLSKHNSVQAAAVALQNDFEDLVLENQQLRAKACKAYVSWVRFYSSYPRDIREIFNRKELHLGHYAKSFALRDPPQRIGGIGKKLREKEISRPRHDNRLSNKSSDGVPQKKQRTRDGDGQRTGLLKRVRMLNTSEYDSGLEPPKKPKK